MAGEIVNTKADTALKNEQLRWEPIKAMSAAFGAGIAFATAIIGLGWWIIAHLLHVAARP